MVTDTPIGGGADMVDITFWIQISQLGFTVVLTDLPGGDQALSTVAIHFDAGSKPVSLF
ncbi:hypothetical protein HFO49_25510 [Rhizobium leguminosarum]|uniref:hypothetical protein n=1 Tax=Rhizobium leguminosarum TaxID=384 RepID=UPI001C981844|nr:hypothetical protein [Rhizobium leguminosarum]MBY5590808.1 hypothetical protein [Rhizobium leguminosarum]MBY5604458.1 hypothetical protein [Rhizobium leguminosarum]